MSLETARNDFNAPVQILVIENRGHNVSIAADDEAKIGSFVPHVNNIGDFLNKTIIVMASAEEGEKDPRVLGFVWEYSGTVVWSPKGYSLRAPALVRTGYKGKFNLTIAADGRLHGEAV